MKIVCVKIVDVDFLENLLVDCRQIESICCHLHLVRPPPHLQPNFRAKPISTTNERNL